MLDVTDNELTVTLRVPEGRWLWLVSRACSSSSCFGMVGFVLVTHCWPLSWVCLHLSGPGFVGGRWDLWQELLLARVAFLGR